MESTIKTFFKGLKVVRLVHNPDDEDEKKDVKKTLEKSLIELNKLNKVKARIRPDTNVKQYHAH